MCVCVCVSNGDPLREMGLTVTQKLRNLSNETNELWLLARALIDFYLEVTLEGRVNDSMRIR